MFRNNRRGGLVHVLCITGTECVTTQGFLGSRQGDQATINSTTHQSLVHSAVIGDAARGGGGRLSAAARSTGHGGGGGVASGSVVPVHTLLAVDARGELLHTGKHGLSVSLLRSPSVSLLL